MRIPVVSREQLINLCDTKVLKQCAVCDHEFTDEDIEKIKENSKCPYCKSDILFAESDAPFIDCKEYLLMETVDKLYSAIIDQIHDKKELEKYITLELGIDPRIIEACIFQLNHSNIQLPDEAREDVIKHLGF